MSDYFCQECNRFHSVDDGCPIVADLQSQLAAAQERVKFLETAFSEVNEIRNSIIGYQSINWSAHVYPLVAILENAGFKGGGYEEAKKKAQTQLQRIENMEQEITRLQGLLEEIENHKHLRSPNFYTADLQHISGHACCAAIAARRKEKA